MWYKNIQVYKINNLKKYSEEELESILEAEKFEPCGPTDLIKSGWDVVIENDPENKLVRKVQNKFFLRLRTEEKIIPSSVVKEELKEHVAKYIEENEGRKPSKTEKDDMKENITMTLAQHAFKASKFTEGYIDRDNELLFVNAGSASKSDFFTSELRTALDSLDISTLDIDDVSDKLASWMCNNSRPREFEIGISCDLKDLEGGTISVKKHEVDVEEITQHLSNGKNVTKLELVWQKRVRFSLTNKFEIKGIKPEDIIKENIEEELGEANDAYNIFQANMLFMSGDFAELVTDLLNDFG